MLEGLRICIRGLEGFLGILFWFGFSSRVLSTFLAIQANRVKTGQKEKLPFFQSRVNHPEEQSSAEAKDGWMDGWMDGWEGGRKEKSDYFASCKYSNDCCFWSWWTESSHRLATARTTPASVASREKTHSSRLSFQAFQLTSGTPARRDWMLILEHWPRDNGQVDRRIGIAAPIVRSLWPPATPGILTALAALIRRHTETMSPVRPTRRQPRPSDSFSLERRSEAGRNRSIRLDK